MENFNSESAKNYRDNLAESLTRKRNIEGGRDLAKEQLEIERNTDDYKSAKIQHKEDNLSRLEEIPESITTTYTNPEGEIENIELNLEKNLERYKSFYSEHQIETPDNFESEIKRIWAENADQIKQAIEQEGFDDMLLIPPYDSVDINQKTTEQGDYVFKDGKPTKTYEGVTISEITDTKPNQPRIVLIHRKNAENLERPELSKTKDQSIYDLCNATTEAEEEKINELIKNKQPLPIDGLTLGEYQIADRIHFKETGKHLDDINQNSVTWLPASYSSASVVCSYWDQVDSLIGVCADDPRRSLSNQGCRSARTFTLRYRNIRL